MGRASKPLRFVPIVPFPGGTLAPMRNRVKGWAWGIRPRCCLRYIRPLCRVAPRGAPLPRARRDEPGLGVVLAFLLGDASQGLRVPHVDPTPPHLHAPLAPEPPQGRVPRHP